MDRHMSEIEFKGEIAKLAHQRPPPPCVIDGLAAVDVEVAIGADGAAERPVHVDAEARLVGLRLGNRHR